MTRYLNSLKARWSALEKKMMPVYAASADPLTFWRERILFIICFFITLFGPISLIPSIILSYREGLWHVMVIDMLAYAAAVLILLARNTAFTKRVFVFCLTLYLLAITILFSMGPVGAGYIWLFGASVFISSFLGLRASGIALAVNAVILASVALHITYGHPFWVLTIDGALEKWVVMSINFLIANLLVVITTAFLHHGLKKAFLAEQKISQDLRENDELLRSYLENAPDGITLSDLKGKILYVNRQYESMLGYARKELIGRNLLSANLMPEQGLHKAAELVRKNLSGQPSGTHEIVLISKGDERIPVDINLSVVRDHQQHVILAFVRDVSERKRVEEISRLSEERFRRIFEDAPFGMALIAPERTLLAVNKVFCGLLQYGAPELIGLNVMALTAPDDRKPSRQLLEQLFSNQVPAIGLDKRYVKKDGALLWAHTTVTAVLSAEGQTLYGLAVIEDLTQSREAAEKIHHLAYYDSLTGLPNRTFHKELIKRSIDHAKRRKERFAILNIGLDNFQRINDSLGYAVGDRLLQTVASRLTQALRQSDDVARSADRDTVDVLSRAGGDAFVVLAHDLTRIEDAATTSRRLLEDLSAPYDIDGHEIFLTASIGIALYPDDAADVDGLLANAEKAMRHTKQEGKNNSHFYSPSMNASILETLTLEGDLRKAIHRGELILYYQPKARVQTRRLCGMEALLRWKHPERGLIAPMQFIPIAEASGLIIPIGEWVIREACRQISQWRAQGHEEPLSVAVNVSSRQFDQQNLTKIVSDALRETDIAPSCLDLEITESTLMKNPEKAIRTITELKSMGIRISIDDFGTGYSSLSYLKRLPLDYIKIDQSFVRGLATDARDQVIVRATIAMAHSLDLQTIAEGVETEEQLDFLRDYRCDEIQGYLLARPLPVEELQDILNKGCL